MTATTTPSRYDDMSRQELYDLAQERDIDGRSEMSKEELAAALELDDLGPDAVALLRRQHDEFRAIFEEFESLSNRPSQKKTDLVRDLITKLVKHAEIEEQVFYPAVRTEIDGADDDVDEDLEEHHAAELLMSELDHMDSTGERYDAKVTVLIENVRHHLEEEEEELFPQVVEGMSEERRRELGGAMQRQWELAPTRPHPHSPDTPPANVLAGLPATVLDLAVGGFRYVRKLITRR